MQSKRTFGLKLWQKGLLLLGALILCEVVVLARFYGMIQEVNAEALQLQKQRNMVHASEEMAEAYVQVGTSFAAMVGAGMLGMGYETARNRFEEANARVGPAFAKIDEYAATEPAAGRERYSQVKQALLNTSAELKQAEQRMDQGQEYNSKAFKHELMPHIKNVIAQLTNFVNDNKEVTARQEFAQEARMREMGMTVLLWSAGVFLIFVLGSAMFFWRSVMSNLIVLADNNDRLARGQSLRPRLHGNDEISNIDNGFHAMAEALEESNKRERQAAQRTRDIIDHMPVGLVTIDGAGTIVSANPRTAEMFGRNVEEMSGRPIDLLFVPATAHDTASLVADLLERALDRVAEYRAQKADATAFPVEVSLSEFSSQENERYLVNFLDITERYEVERMKREFVAMVSHDLRTPLTSVEASLTLLGAGALGQISKDAEETIAVAEQQIARLRNLVNDLLDMAKIEAGKMDMQVAEVELSAVIEECVNEVRILAKERHVNLKVETNDAVAMADGSRLVQVLVNFLSNALKYSPAGSSVELRVVSSSEWHEVQVTDHGPGIPAEKQEAIFHRFEQAKGSSQQQGTGLGLAMAKAIIEQLGGLIGVTSSEGEGATFWFRIPAAKRVTLKTPQLQKH